LPQQKGKVDRRVVYDFFGVWRVQKNDTFLAVHPRRTKIIETFQLGKKKGQEDPGKEKWVVS
jgi:hypothetical protein